MYLMLEISRPLQPKPYVIYTDGLGLVIAWLFFAIHINRHAPGRVMNALYLVGYKDAKDGGAAELPFPESPPA